MAAYVQRPAGQAGVNQTETYIQRSFTWSASGSMEVDYLVSSEAGWDLFRVFVDNLGTVHGGGTAASTQSGNVGSHATPATLTVNSIASGAHTIRFTYLKDSSDAAGTDEARVYAIRRYEGGVLVETHVFGGSSDGQVPSGWTTGNFNQTGDVGTWRYWADGGGGGTTISPGLTGPSSTVPSPGLHQTLTGAAPSSSATVPSPTVTQTITAPLVASGGSVPSPTLGLAVTGSAPSSSAAVLSPALALGVTAPFMASGSTVPSPVVTYTAPGNVAPTFLASGASFPNAAIALSVAGGAPASGASVPSPTVALVTTLAPAFLGSGFAAPSGAVSLGLTGGVPASATVIPSVVVTGGVQPAARPSGCAVKVIEMPASMAPLKWVPEALLERNRRRAGYRR